MVSFVPFIVEYDQNKDEWIVRAEKDGDIVDRYGTKDEAIDEAAYTAEGDDRPGVVVFTDIGEYSHFVENPHFWSGEYWDYIE